MSRLLTDEQVKEIAPRGAEGVAELIWLARPDLSEKRVERLQEAANDNLADFLEGLTEPDEGEGS